MTARRAGKEDRLRHYLNDRELQYKWYYPALRHDAEQTMASIASHPLPEVTIMDEAVAQSLLRALVTLGYGASGKSSNSIRTMPMSRRDKPPSIGSRSREAMGSENKLFDLASLQVRVVHDHGHWRAAVFHVRGKNELEELRRRMCHDPYVEVPDIIHTRLTQYDGIDRDQIQNPYDCSLACYQMTCSFGAVRLRERMPQEEDDDEEVRLTQAEVPGRIHTSGG